MQKIKIYNLRLGMALALVLGLTACDKDELPPKPQPSAFSATVENNTVSFAPSGGTANIVVNGGTNGWWITMPANNWCVITRQYGSGDLKVPLTIRPNTSGAPRDITIKVHPTFDQPPVEIKLTQSN